MSRYLTIARHALENSSRPEKPGLQRGLNQLEPQLEPQDRGSNQLEPRWSPGFSGGDENPPTVPITSAAPAPPVGGRWKMPIQLWGIDQSRDLVESLKEAAGPNRVTGLDELFAHMDAQWRWSGSRKIEWLQQQRDRMKAHPLYWPRLRAPRVCDDAKTIIACLKTGPKTKAWLSRKLRKTITATSSLTTPMAARGSIVRIEEAVFALPCPGAKTFLPASHAIITALIGAPGHSMKFLALEAAVGRTIARPVHTLRLRRNGALTPADPSRRGPVTLAPAALAKIERGEPIRDGRGGILWAPDLYEAQLDLFA
jgi:hypothetical protein